MLKPNIPLNLFLLLVLKCSFAYGQGLCPPNEVPTECEDSCNRCDTNIMCPAVCLPGCQCLPGYTRDEDNVCIPRQLCAGFGGLPSDSLSRIPYETFPEETLAGRGLLSTRGGCPNSQLCTLSCRGRGLLSGVCLGPGREYCNCYSNLSGGNKNPPLPETTKNIKCPNLGQCITGCQQRQFASGYCSSGDCKCVGLPSAGIAPRYMHGPPPPPVAPYPPGPPIAPKLPLVPISPGLPIIPPKLPLVPKPPKIPFVPLPPIVKPPPVLPKGDCPDIAKCIIKCQSKGSSTGFCTGFNRGTCQCL